MEKFNELKTLIEALVIDADKFYNAGTAAAGGRLRKGMQDVKAFAQQVRVDVSATKNAKKKD